MSLSGQLDLAFTRELMKRAHADARPVYLARKGVMLNTRKAAWVWSGGRDHWEFHGPDGFFWHGSAANAYEARAKGWWRWIENPNGKY